MNHLIERILKKSSWSEIYRYHLRQHYGLKKELFFRALAMKGGEDSFIWDLTMGMGHDALMMLSVGAHVYSIEKSPLAWELTEAQRNLFAYPDLFQRWQMKKSDALTFLEQQKINNEENTPDVIYLDFMFFSDDQGRKKTALPSLEMQFLRSLGDETKTETSEQEEIIRLGKTLAKKRVVLKRSLREKSELGVRPDFSLKGKSIRYDIFLANSKTSS